MHKYNPLAATIRIISHNMNRKPEILDTLLNSAAATADIILLQETNVTDPTYAVTDPNFMLVLPPRGDRRSKRTAAYISRMNPYLRVSQRTDICEDPDLQILEVGTDLIPSFFLLNIYNERYATSKLYTIPCHESMMTCSLGQ
jgi:exonuclease III